MPLKQRDLEEGHHLSHSLCADLVFLGMMMPCQLSRPRPNQTGPCPPKIQWDFNERWIDCLIEFLSNNPDVCLRMFSDLVKDVRKESWKKVKTLLWSLNLAVHCCLGCWYQAKSWILSPDSPGSFWCCRWGWTHGLCVRPWVLCYFCHGLDHIVSISH